MKICKALRNKQSITQSFLQTKIKHPHGKKKERKKKKKRGRGEKRMYDKPQGYHEGAPFFQVHVPKVEINYLIYCSYCC
jgi:hypothetical protein